ncbi:MAG: cupin domain-containing protein [Alphaproteobacteria bacterium]|nr:cupin domain-containing protein [Alphaproteobacteria bacterium]
MLVRKKESASVLREDAHGGSGGRRLYATERDMACSAFSAMTYGFLPAGAAFDWHKHEGIEEIMLVLKGRGTVEDREGKYGYAEGDLFIYPAGVEHRIENTGDVEDEFVFIRVRV